VRVIDKLWRACELRLARASNYHNVVWLGDCVVRVGRQRPSFEFESACGASERGGVMRAAGEGPPAGPPGRLRGPDRPGWRPRAAGRRRRSLAWPVDLVPAI
jgi:hypothetical protein